MLAGLAAAVTAPHTAAGGAGPPRDELVALSLRFLKASRVLINTGLDDARGWQVLALLCSADGPKAVSDIKREISAGHRNLVYRTVRQLEDLGLARRFVPENSHVTLVEALPAGRGLLLAFLDILVDPA